MKKSSLLICVSAIMLLILSGMAASGQTDSYQIRKVMIDPGHGGKDPGALGKKSKEKNLTLQIAKKLGFYIEQNVPGVEVAYTRSNDQFVELGRRAEIANELRTKIVNDPLTIEQTGYQAKMKENEKDHENLFLRMSSLEKEHAALSAKVDAKFDAITEQLRETKDMVRQLFDRICKGKK